MSSESSDEVPLEIQLMTLQSISKDVWKRFEDAVAYDSATPVRWAAGMLKIIHARVLADEKIPVPHLEIILTKWNFEDVVTEQFSAFFLSEILKSK